MPTSRHSVNLNIKIFNIILTQIERGKMKVINIYQLFKFLNETLETSLDVVDEKSIKEVVDPKATLKAFATVLFAMICHDGAIYEVNEDDLIKSGPDPLLQLITESLLMDSNKGDRYL